MSGPWLLHIDDDTRALTHAVVNDAIASLSKAGRHAWTVDDESVELVLPRAVALNGSTRAARFTLRDGTWSLFAPASGGPRRMHFAAFGRTVGEADPSDPTSGLLTTLASWRDGLAAPVDPVRQQETGRFRDRIAGLGLGLMEDAGMAWSWFDVHPGGRGRHHSITVRPAGASNGEHLSFRSDAQHAGGPAMTPELVDELNRLVGERLHVSEGHVRRPGEMPSVFIGWPPRVRVEPTDDVVSRMRGVRSVPPGARLTVPRSIRS